MIVIIAIVMENPDRSKMDFNIWNLMNLWKLVVPM